MSYRSSYMDVFQSFLSGVNTDVAVTEIVDGDIVKFFSDLFVCVKVVYRILFCGRSGIMHTARQQ